MMKALLLCAAMLACVAAMPAATFDPSALQAGQAAPAGVARTDGRPLVIDVFASWCVGCIDELPRVLADYARYKDRVDFIGIDYLDSTSGGEAVMDKFKIPFPVVRSQPNETAPEPADKNTAFPAGATMHLSGIAPEQFPQMVGAIAAQLNTPALNDIAAYCKAHSNADCITYAQTHGVAFGASPPATSAKTATTQATTNMKKSLTLPMVFVVDAHGVVQAAVTGYDSAHDPIVSELAKLGIQ